MGTNIVSALGIRLTVGAFFNNNLAIKSAIGYELIYKTGHCINVISSLNSYKETPHIEHKTASQSEIKI